jgi:hypothetical protein
MKGKHAKRNLHETLATCAKCRRTTFVSKRRAWWLLTPICRVCWGEFQNEIDKAARAFARIAGVAVAGEQR